MRQYITSINATRKYQSNMYKTDKIDLYGLIITTFNINSMGQISVHETRNHNRTKENGIVNSHTTGNCFHLPPLNLNVRRYQNYYYRTKT